MRFVIILIKFCIYDVLCWAIVLA